MFDIIKQQISLISKLEKDLGVTFRLVGEKNWKIDGDKTVEACPFCGHHDCFRVKHEEDSYSNSFYKCFSCGQHGDILNWQAIRQQVSLKIAAKQLAEEYGISIPNDYNPIQQIFNLAGSYYHNCLIDSCNKPSPLLSGLTPLRYQLEVRKHKPESIDKFNIGFSDGGLVEYLTGVGIEFELIKASGLINKKDKDFLPSNCFIYPHYCKGQISHFTFKDPLKKIQYQLPKKYSLNGYQFYGQDYFNKSPVIMLVEGENDWISIMESGSLAGMAIIGQISQEQIDWIKANGKDKKIITLFDPDDAGDMYRQKLESIKPNLKGLVHVYPPNNKDIDENLTSNEGGGLENIIRSNIVTVKPREEVLNPEAASLNKLWNEIKGLEEPEEKQEEEQKEEQKEELKKSPEDTSDELLDLEEEGSITQEKGCYFKTKFVKEGKEFKVLKIRLSNFVLKLLNVYEDFVDRYREIQIIRYDGKVFPPFLVDSETKVTARSFKILVARYGDCEWLGKDNDLEAIWRLIYRTFPDKTISLSNSVGRNSEYNCWVFRDVLITKEGTVVTPDENDVFWPNSDTRGIKIKTISDGEHIEDIVPSLKPSKGIEETKLLLKQAIDGIGTVLTELGDALLAVGWIKSNVYSDEIFKYNNGFGSLMLWGQAGKGKSTIARWLQSFYGFTERMGSTSVQQLGQRVGFLRKAEYYASIPLFLDELRANEESNKHLGMIRSWYDREGRTLADISDKKKIVNQKIRASLLIAGEDLPFDPATKERCIFIRVPPSLDPKNPDTQRNFHIMRELSEDFGNIAYHWILESCAIDKKTLLKNIRELDFCLVKSGCTNRISKVYSSAAYFGLEFAKEFYPEYDFMEYLVRTAVMENMQQQEDNNLSKFLIAAEHLQNKINTPLTEEIVSRDTKDPNLIHIWYSAFYKEIVDFAKRAGEDFFSKNAILRALKEEDYFISDDKKITMGISQRRRVVITLDLAKAPASVRNLVNYQSS